jgi:hypothetical protein
VSDVLNLFFKPLTAEEIQYGYFLQDDATAHTADKSTAIIYEVLENKIISKSSDFLHNLVLVIADYYL